MIEVILEFGATYPDWLSWKIFEKQIQLSMFCRVQNKLLKKRSEGWKAFTKEARRHVTMIFRGSKHISSVSENRLISLLALACSSRSLWGICDAFKIPTFGKVQKILYFFSTYTVAPFLLILIRRQMCITRLWSNSHIWVHPITVFTNWQKSRNELWIRVSTI